MRKKRPTGTVWAQFWSPGNKETRKAPGLALNSPETNPTRPRRKSFPSGRGMTPLRAEKERAPGVGGDAALRLLANHPISGLPEVRHPDFRAVGLAI